MIHTVKQKLKNMKTRQEKINQLVEQIIDTTEDLEAMVAEQYPGDDVEETIDGFDMNELVSLIYDELHIQPNNDCYQLREGNFEWEDRYDHDIDPNKPSEDELEEAINKVDYFNTPIYRYD